MASNRVLAKSINMPFLQSNNKFIYVSLLVVLSFFLLLDYVPSMHAYSAWVTPPLALFLGLAFALLCGQAHPKFNKKTSKYLLQYSVVGVRIWNESAGFPGFGQGGNGVHDYFCCGDIAHRLAHRT